MRIALAAVGLALCGGPAFADCNAPASIDVAAGAAESTVAADTPTTTLDCYQLTARAGEQLSITLGGAKNDAVFTLLAPGWRAHCDAVDDCDIDGEALSEDEAKSWADTLPTSGAYLIVIDNSRSDSDYRLNVVLQAAREPPG
jgi:hypothetical protein